MVASSYKPQNSKDTILNQVLLGVFIDMGKNESTKIITETLPVTNRVFGTRRLVSRDERLDFRWSPGTPRLIPVSQDSVSVHAMIIPKVVPQRMFG
jgi:hypothetical protein